MAGNRVLAAISLTALRRVTIVIRSPFAMQAALSAMRILLKI
jgi:hypothetical protein